jgi:glycosyltransferase involved in cell wall biosynthesis
MKCLKYADEIIVVSNSTKSDLIKYFNIKHDRINVIYLGIDNLYRSYNYLEKIKAKKINSLYNDSFKILLTGSQIYKNHSFAIEVIKAFSKLTTRRVQVIKSGNENTILDDALKNTNIDYKNIFCCDVNEMAGLYNSVDCLLFPSNYEGFGLPPLEAMACGLPVIISDIDVFKETIPKYDGKIPLTDFNSFVNILLRISDDNIFKNNLIQSGFNIAKKFTWENTIKKTIEVYNQNTSKI